MKRPFLALFACLALTAVAEAGPRDRIQARREARSAAFAPVGPRTCPQGICTPCNCVDESKCGPAGCPTFSPYPLPAAFQSPCPGGKCPVPARR